MPNFKRITLSNGTSWSVATAGSGPVLVLLHGYPIDSRLWSQNIESLAVSHTVIAPDFPGFGNSKLPPDKGIYRMSELADDVASVLDEMRTSKAVAIAGLSMGGYVALEFWKRHGHRLSHLVFCNSRVVGDTEDAKQNRLRTAENVYQDGVEPIIKTMLPKLLAEHSPPEIRETVTEMMRSATTDGIAAVQRGMAERSDFTESMPEIDLPMLCVVGAEDSISTPSEMLQISRKINRCEFIEVKGAAHLTPLEQPDMFNETVSRFLGRG